MAKFTRYRIRKDMYPQSVWKKIKDLLVVYESVEVVVVDPTTVYSEFELHAWDGVRGRGDKSNGPDASPNEDY